MLCSCIDYVVLALASDIYFLYIEWLGIHVTIQRTGEQLPELVDSDIAWGKDCFIQVLSGSKVIVAISKCTARVIGDQNACVSALRSVCLASDHDLVRARGRRRSIKPRCRNRPCGGIAS